MIATKKALVGRAIVDVDFQPFPDRKGGTAHRPRLTLDDGRVLYFVTEETEVGDYGTSICITTKPGRAPRRKSTEVLIAMIPPKGSTEKPRTVVMGSREERHLLDAGWV